MARLQKAGIKTTGGGPILGTECSQEGRTRQINLREIFQWRRYQSNKGWSLTHKVTLRCGRQAWTDYKERAGLDCLCGLPASGT